MTREEANGLRAPKCYCCNKKVHTERSIFCSRRRPFLNDTSLRWMVPDGRGQRKHKLQTASQHVWWWDLVRNPITFLDSETLILAPARPRWCKLQKSFIWPRFMISSFSVLACIDQSTQKKGHSSFLNKPRHNNTATSVGFDILKIKWSIKFGFGRSYRWPLALNLVSLKSLFIPPTSLLWGSSAAQLRSGWGHNLGYSPFCCLEGMDNSVTRNKQDILVNVYVLCIGKNTEPQQRQQTVTSHSSARICF